MQKYTLSQLRTLVNTGAAVNATNYRPADFREVKAAEGYLTQIGYSSGVYGCTGQLLQGHNTGRLYAITGRTAAIYSH